MHCFARCILSMLCRLAALPMHVSYIIVRSFAKQQLCSLFPSYLSPFFLHSSILFIVYLSASARPLFCSSRLKPARRVSGLVNFSICSTKNSPPTRVVCAEGYLTKNACSQPIEFSSIRATRTSYSYTDNNFWFAHSLPSKTRELVNSGKKTHTQVCKVMMK